MNRVDRLVGYLLLFQSRRRLRARDLAQRFEVSERTVYRDVQALCEVGVPIVGMPGEGYELLEGYSLPPVMFTESEARALYLSIAMLTGLAQAGETRQAAQTALEKVRAILPPATLAKLEALETIVGFYAVARPPLDLDDTRFAELQQAIQARRVVHLRYHALYTNEVTERDVEPLELAYVDNAWILGAYCRLRQDQRYFRLDRIDHLRVTREEFVPQGTVRHGVPQGDLRIVVRFEPAVVRWVRERQHYALVEEREAEDGGAIMVYSVPSAQQILSWLLGWGEEMEVLAPQEVRAEIARRAARTFERHR